MKPRFWQGIFLLVLAIRACAPFIYNPMSHLYSDPGRHWWNGVRFFTPDVMGSSDPFLYQLWMHGVWRITHGAPYGVALMAALLCVMLPCFWYKALRELLPEREALVGASLIGITPTLISIYSYSANECLGLVLMAAAVWLSLRAINRRSQGDTLIAALLWALAVYTKMVAGPAAVIFLAAAVLRQRQRGLLVLAGALPFALMSVPACWHSRLVLNFCAPLGNTYLNAVYHDARSQVIEFNVAGRGQWGFASPATGSPPFAPLSDWLPGRSGTYHIEINPAFGARDWQAALADVRSRWTWRDELWSLRENATQFFFSPSWPDDRHDYKLGLYNYYSRWIWLPLTLLLAGLCWKRRRSLRADWPRALIPLTAFALTGLMMVQHSGVMEGRYRKPVEPFILAGLALMLAWPRRTEDDGLSRLE